MAALAPLAPNAHRYGPFVALDRGDHGHGAVVRAFDPVLRRQVWIEVNTPRRPRLAARRRDLARPGRLHWLTGRRSADESWDAYEAPDGGAWTDTIAARTWRQTNLELLDLVDELSSAATDDTQPPLALDRIWLRDNGRVVLLDFAPPGAPSRGRTHLTPEQLLHAAAGRVPRGASEPGLLPLSAHRFLDRWSGTELPPLADARDTLTSMAGAPNYVHWWRRGIPGTLAAAPVVLMLVVTSVLVPALGRFQSSETMGMMNLLGVLQSTPRANNPMQRPEVRNAAELAIAGRYGPMIRDESFWQSGIVRSLAPEYRALAEDILKRHPEVSAAQLAEAEKI
jgi:hypothetical protein